LWYLKDFQVEGRGPVLRRIDFSGHYRLFQLNYWNQGFDGQDDKSNDFYFVNRLQMDFGFHATDEVSVYWRLRAPAAQRWGTSTGSNGNTGNVRSIFYYGEVKQDWGTLAIGKLNDGRTMFGLASLGWVPGGPDVNVTGFEPFDIDDATDGIHYVNRWDNGFQLAAAFLRLNTEFNASDGDDQTGDLFVVESAYFWDGGGASLGLHYLRDNTGDFNSAPDGKSALKMFRLNPAAAHSFGDFSVHFEGMAGWGSYDDNDNNGKSVDVEGYAFYADVDYNYGPGNINLAGWWASGAKEGDTKDKGAVGMGAGAFNPLVVAYSQLSYGWNRGSNTPFPGETSRRGPVDAVSVANAYSNGGRGADLANHWGLDLNGAHAFTDDLTLTYALAYLALNESNDGAKKSIGFEADLGLQIQLLDNLHFGTTFGYLFAGDALTPRDEFGVKLGDKEDAYTWVNTLTFTF
jgi:hypothetical protein